MAAVGFEPPTSRSGVRHSTTEPPRSPLMIATEQVFMNKRNNFIILNSKLTLFNRKTVQMEFDALIGGPVFESSQ